MQPSSHMAHQRAAIHLGSNRFQPQLADKLYQLVILLQQHCKRQHQTKSKSGNAESMLIAYRLQTLLQLIKKVLPKALNYYPHKHQKIHTEALSSLNALMALLKKGFPKATNALYLSGFKPPTEEVWRYMQFLPRMLSDRINHLQLASCNLDTSQWFMDFASLESLDIYSSTLTLETIKIIGGSLPNLRRLTLANIPELSEEAVLTALVRNPQLQKLTISSCAAVTGRIIQPLAKVCRQLQRLDLYISNRSYAADEQDVLALVNMKCRLSVTIHSVISSRAFWNLIRVVYSSSIEGFQLLDLWGVLNNKQYH